MIIFTYSYNGKCCKNGLAPGFTINITISGRAVQELVQKCAELTNGGDGNKCNSDSLTKAGRCCEPHGMIKDRNADGDITYTTCKASAHNHPTSKVIDNKGRYCSQGVANTLSNCNYGGPYEIGMNDYNSKLYAILGKYCKNGVAQNKEFCNQGTKPNGGICPAASLTQSGNCCYQNGLAYGVHVSHPGNKTVAYACQNTVCPPSLRIYPNDNNDTPKCCSYKVTAKGVACAVTCNKPKPAALTISSRRCCTYGITKKMEKRCNMQCPATGDRTIKKGFQPYSATNVLTAGGNCCKNGIIYKSLTRYTNTNSNIKCNETGDAYVEGGFNAFSTRGRGCTNGLAYTKNGKTGSDCREKCPDITHSINTSHGACQYCKFGPTQAYYRTVKRTVDHKTVYTLTKGPIISPNNIHISMPKTKGGLQLYIGRGLTENTVKGGTGYETAGKKKVIIGATNMVTANKKPLVLKGRQCNHKCSPYENSIKGSCTRTAVYNQTKDGWVCPRGAAICGKSGKSCMTKAIHRTNAVNIKDYSTIASSPNQVCAINYGTHRCNQKEYGGGTTAESNFCYKNPTECEPSKHGAFCGYSTYGKCLDVAAAGSCLVGGRFPSRNGVTNIGVNEPACSNTITQYTKGAGASRECVICPYGVTTAKKNGCNKYCGCNAHTKNGECTDYKAIRNQTKSGKCCPGENSAVCGTGKKCTSKFKNAGKTCLYGTYNCNNCFKTDCPRLRNNFFCGNTKSGGCIKVSDNSVECSLTLTDVKNPPTKYKPVYYPSVSFRYTAGAAVAIG